MKRYFKVIIKDNMNSKESWELHSLSLEQAVRVSLKYKIAFIKEDDEIWQ